MAREGLVDSNREEARLALERLEYEQKVLLQRAFAAQLSTPEGRMFMRWLLLITQWNEPAMTGNSQTFYTLGKQDVGRQIRGSVAGADLRGWRLLEDEIQADATLRASLQSPNR